MHWGRPWGVFWRYFGSLLVFGVLVARLGCPWALSAPSLTYPGLLLKALLGRVKAIPACSSMFYHCLENFGAVGVVV